MVDALRRVRNWITATGRIVDLHPTADVASIWVGAINAGPIDPGSGSARHRAASEAIAAAVGEGLLTIEDATEFEFSTYADAIEELDEHILTDWRDARIPDATMCRARQLVTRPAAPVCVRERVSAMRLRA